MARLTSHAWLMDRGVDYYLLAMRVSSIFVFFFLWIFSLWFTYMNAVVAKKNGNVVLLHLNMHVNGHKV